MTGQEQLATFHSIAENVGRFRLKGKIFLIPEMNRIGCHLLAGTFRSFGIQALVLDTYKGLDLGKEFSSGKECFPCLVTAGDILYFLREEQSRLGNRFDPEKYIYFMPESAGPCRFGMYNKFQRMILDSFPKLRHLKIGSLTTKDSYSLNGLLEKDKARDFRKVAYHAVIVSDILDRLHWRIRPYERKPGMTDEFIENAMGAMVETFETCGAKKAFDKIGDRLEEIILEGKDIIDPDIPPKPLIGIVGEIYLRSHIASNQDIIRMLERYGAEVVDASIGEWVNFITYERKRSAKIELRLALKQLRFDKIKAPLKNLLGHRITLSYQEMIQRRLYNRAQSLINLAGDHRIGHLEEIVEKKGLYSFDVGTEACLSIPGILEYVREGFNGVVNVYPFTCMPSTITSSIVKPIMSREKVPYLDSPYDGTYQPGREAGIRTFMYQARQHLERNGRTDLGTI